MKILTAMKRLNRRFDAWAMRSAIKIVDDLDHRDANSRKPETKNYVGVSDPLPDRRDSVR